LPEIDQHALFQLDNVVKNIKESYETYEFFKIYQMIQRFAIVDLSNFYFDVAKDRLYVGGASSFTRRSCQTVLAAHLLAIVRVIAPILPHLAEDVWQNLPFEYSIDYTDVAKFVFESKWPEVNERWLAFPEKDIDFWGNILELRTEVNKALETARTGKLIGSSLEAKVYLHSSDDSLAQRLRNMCEARLDADSLNRIFITSQVEILSTLEDAPSENIPYSGDYLIQGVKKIWIGVSRAEGSKCERCWNFSPQVGSFLDHPTLCKRCYDVIAGQPLPALAAAN
nr:isoleucine--tRNA ligase, chloroplastic/mitochondrial [Tanacetum cinerariifolium]